MCRAQWFHGSSNFTAIWPEGEKNKTGCGNIFHQAADLQKVCSSCSNLPGHNGTFTYWAEEAQLVILRGREGLFSLELPRGSEFQAAVGPCPAASSVWRRPEGQRQGSLWHWIICPSVIVPAGRDARDCVSAYVCIWNIFMQGFASSTSLFLKV